MRAEKKKRGKPNAEEITACTENWKDYVNRCVKTGGRSEKK